MIAEREDTGEVVGMAMTIPDLNQVLAKMNGRLLPFGWWYFAAQRARSWTACASASSASSPSTSTPASRRRLYQLHFDAAEARPQKGGEMGWILETNTAMNRGMEAMGGTVVKRYRMYERELAADGRVERSGPAVYTGRVSEIGARSADA